MFKKKTLFIVGAGASSDFNLPIGSQLCQIISAKLRTTVDIMHSHASFNDPIARSFLSYCSKNNYSYEQIIKEALLIANAMPQALSIDNFLNTHNKNELIKNIGKIAITVSILEQENASNLNPTKANRKLKKADILSQTKESWLNIFFKMLTEDIDKNNLNAIFDNVAIITFNYDRTIETYIKVALENYFDISDDESTELIKKLIIIHPYGQIGYLKWQSENRIVHYGQSSDGLDFIDLSKSIRTFSEQHEDESLILSMKDQLNIAEKIIFLGLSYGKINLDLLGHSLTEAKSIFGTTYLLSTPNIIAIEKRLHALINTKNSFQRSLATERIQAKDFLLNHWWPILYD